MFEKVKEIADSCSCGKKHNLLTEEFVISEGAEYALADYIARKNYKNPLLICDENTHKFVENLKAPIEQRNILIFGGDVHATEVQVAIAEEAIKKDAPDVLVVFGSGSLHDITRYAAHKVGLPFISYPTAASVDGFISGVAAMTWYKQKLTFEATPPIAVFADPNVFCTAPARLTSSGVGDVLGKYNSLFDWKIGKIFTGEYYCEEIVKLTEDAVDEVVEAIKNRNVIGEKEYTTKVMYALLLSGLAIQLTGNSRPASGAEHHLSHLWEMHLINEETDALHGEKVAVGLLAVARVYKKAMDGGLDYERIGKINLGEVMSFERLEPIYKAQTEATLRENLPNGTLSSSSLAKIDLSDIERIERELAEAAEKYPSAEALEELYRLADVPMVTDDIGLPADEGFIEKTLRFAPYVRNRLTLLKILSAADLI